MRFRYQVGTISLSYLCLTESLTISPSDTPIRCPPLIFVLTANGFSASLRDEYFALKNALAEYHASLPPFSDTRGIKPYEAVSIFNPHILLAHTTHHGSVLLLHGLMAGENPEARAKVIESAKALADICWRIRGGRGIRRVQGFLVPVVSFGSLSFLLQPS